MNKFSVWFSPGCVHSKCKKKYDSWTIFDSWVTFLGYTITCLWHPSWILDTLTCNMLWWLHMCVSGLVLGYWWLWFIFDYGFCHETDWLRLWCFGSWFHGWASFCCLLRGQDLFTTMIGKRKNILKVVSYGEFYAVLF